MRNKTPPDCSEKVKPFNCLEPSLVANISFFLVTVLFISGLSYLKFETVANSTKRPRWLSWLGFNGSSWPFMSPFLILKSHENERVGFLDQEGGDGCDIFDGNWVWDESYPLYKSPDCPFMDGGFRCSEHGRPNDFYTKWRWQPKACNLPRFDAEKMLEMLRNKRVVFAGDSIARNQWESLLCMLSTAVFNKSSIYELSGNPIKKHSGFLIFKFADFNWTLEYYRSPFLVVQGHTPVGAQPEVKYAIRVDQIAWSSSRWRDSDVLILNSGHWWTYEKTIRQGCYFQEGKEIKMNMSVEAAYRRSLETVIDWVSTHVDKNKALIFFRTNAPTHFRRGNWHTGGGCHLMMLPELGPLVGESYHLKIVLDVFSQRANALGLLNVTNMTWRRKDGHPSIYKKWPQNEPASHHQDCSHWCLPGVPDSWNELLYVLILKQELIQA